MMLCHFSLGVKKCFRKTVRGVRSVAKLAYALSMLTSKTVSKVKISNILVPIKLKIHYQVFLAVLHLCKVFCA